MLNKLLFKMGLLKSSRLDFARNVGKRLDEHRELVQSVEATTLFTDKPWHINHMATQDDYLMRLYYLRHGVWPKEDRTVRPRPEILGVCGLPEFTRFDSMSNDNG